MRDEYPEVEDVNSVGRTMVNAYIDKLRNENSPSTVNKYLFRLRGVFDVMQGVAAVSTNPFDHLSQLQFDSHPRRELTKDEIARLITAARDMGREHYLLVLIAAYTGLRLGECCRLKWSEVDVRRGIIQFAPGKTRRFMNGQLVTVPLHWKVVKALLEIPADKRDGAVLPDLNVKYTHCPNRIHVDLKRMFEAAGIQTSVKFADRSRMTPEASFHSLRHSFVSFAANSGVPLDYLRSIVGHTTTAMTRHYYHADEDSLRMAVASVPVFDAQGNVMQKSDEPLFETREMREARISDRLKEVQNLWLYCKL